MSLLRNKILIALVALISTTSFSQEVIIADSVFARELCLIVPDAMSTDCKRLDTVKVISLYPDLLQLSVQRKRVKTANEIVYFKQVEDVFVSGTDIEAVPFDLKGFDNLKRYNLNNNNLSTLPNIFKENSDGSKEGILVFVSRENNYSDFPEEWEVMNVGTKSINLSGNEFHDLMDFNLYPSLNNLNISGNYLEFDDLEKIRLHPRGDALTKTLFPQRAFEVEIDTIVKLGGSQQISIFKGGEGNNYHMLKDGVEIASSLNGDFVISVNSKQDLGTYTFRVTNSAFPNTETDFLESLPYLLKFRENTVNVREDDFLILSPNGDGEAELIEFTGEGKVKIFYRTGELVREESLPFDWDGTNKYGNIVKPGYYIVEMPHGERLKMFIGY